MYKKKVAICIPAYNDELKLKTLLNSIKIQTFKDFFVVISDDSINDNIRILCDEYKEQFYLIYSRNELPLGPTKNTNRAIAIADSNRYEYLKIMHHDDFFTYDDSLDFFVSMLDEDLDASMAFCNTIQLSPNGTYERYISDDELSLLLDDYRNLVLGNIIGDPSVTIMRKTYLRMDENLLWDVDWEWYMRILHGNRKFQFTRHPLVSIGMGNDTMTKYCQKNQELMLKESIYVYLKNIFLHEEQYSSKLILRLNKYILEEELLNFCKGHEVFIYGAGTYGKYCASILKSHKDIKFAGFIVTEKQKQDEPDETIFSLAEFVSQHRKLDIRIIIAVKTQYVTEIKKALIEKDSYDPENIRIYNPDKTGLFTLHS